MQALPAFFILHPFFLSLRQTPYLHLKTTIYATGRIPYIFPYRIICYILKTKTRKNNNKGLTQQLIVY
jgi:hypothetical protein